MKKTPTIKIKAWGTEIRFPVEAINSKKQYIPTPDITRAKGHERPRGNGHMAKGRGDWGNSPFFLFAKE